MGEVVNHEKLLRKATGGKKEINVELEQEICSKWKDMMHDFLEFCKNADEQRENVAYIKGEDDRVLKMVGEFIENKINKNSLELKDQMTEYLFSYLQSTRKPGEGLLSEEREEKGFGNFTVSLGKNGLDIISKMLEGMGYELNYEADIIGFKE